MKTLDPAFIIVDNNALGSNPNALPNIEIRGKTGIMSIRDGNGQDPNQPLFILDGFETDMRTVLDLDMNRVANVTILKDAASTALYGSRASNGVVVIETKRPREGKLNLAFNYDNTIQMPDVHDYNLMDATEKLEFERLSGKYIKLPNVVDPSVQVDLDKEYNEKLNNVLKGVNSYWLNEPLQVGFQNNFSLYIDGGDKNVTYGIGAKCGKVNGVMKGSGRNIGPYEHDRTDYFFYESYLQSSYGQVFNKIHELNAVAGMMITGRKTIYNGYTAVGFPEGSITSPAFGNAYPETEKPSYSRE